VKPSTGRAELDGMIVEIELTLVSIIQGVALAALIESARYVVTHRDYIYWPYVIAGLLTIFIFWSRAVLHIITVIRWPLEFGHNFLYIACALVEALMFAQLARPGSWFLFGAVFISIGWILFFYDLRLIQARMRDSAGPASNRLFDLVRRDQWLNILLLLPGVLLLNAVCAWMIHARPEVFIRRGVHLYLIAAQLAGFTGYLIYLIRFYSGLAPFIASAKDEWHSNAVSEGAAIARHP
jgi:hypothetical protein